jgi:hypothetical protein
MMHTFRHYMQQRDGGQPLKETAHSSARLQRRLSDAAESARQGSQSSGARR